MSLLDDLKNQAEQRRAEEERNRLEQERLHAIYMEQIVPRMQEAFAYINQLCEHLNYLKTETPAYYPILTDGGLQQFHQRNYKVLIDSTTQPKTITLRFSCELDEPMRFMVQGGAKVEHVAERLKAYRIPHHCKEAMDRDYRVTHANVKVDGPLNVTFVMQADIASSCINMMYNNFEAPGTKTIPLRPEQVDREFLEQLGKFILRENENFMKLEINTDVKDEIRRKIEQEKIKRQQELEEMERLRLEEEAREKEQRSWRNRLKIDLASGNKEKE